MDLDYVQIILYVDSLTLPLVEMHQNEFPLFTNATKKPNKLLYSLQFLTFQCNVVLWPQVAFEQNWIILNCHIIFKTLDTTRFDEFKMLLCGLKTVVNWLKRKLCAASKIVIYPSALVQVLLCRAIVRNFHIAD